MSDFKRRVADFHELTKEVAARTQEALAGELTLDQAVRLKQALDQHADNAAQLLAELEEASEADNLISAARALDVIASQIASSAAQAVMAKRGDVDKTAAT